MSAPAGFTDALRRARVVPVLRTDSAAQALGAIDRLVPAGVSMIELTSTTPDWERALASATAAHPRVTFGLGTVWDAETARCAARLGASFLVSPGRAVEARAVAEAAGIPFLEGGFTPTEIVQASAAGPAKLFPAGLGGPEHLRALLAVLPGRHLVPTGGVRLAEVPRWLAAGALAVGVGSDLWQSADPHAAVSAALSWESTR